MTQRDQYRSWFLISLKTHFHIKDPGGLQAIDLTVQHANEDLSPQRTFSQGKNSYQHYFFMQIFLAPFCFN